MPIPAPTGVFDVLPRVSRDLWRASHLWLHVEQVCRQLAFDYGLSEIRTPIFERSELFKRSIGDATDVVSKEMYLFQDRGGRELALRPEGTASVLRALINEGIFSPTQSLRFFYIGPMFRYERPQSGRFRQHHQFGVEIFGAGAPEQDAELIAALMELYRRLKLPDLKVYVNSLGGPDCRIRFREALVGYLSGRLSELSEDSQRRFDKNPLRILDSKDPGDQEIVAMAPSILAFLDEADSAHFLRLQELLSSLALPFEVSPRLVRGLDYYQRTVFEVTSGKLGSQNTVGGGGRYDGLMKQLGGPDLPSIGFGTGIERILNLMIKEAVDAQIAPPVPTLMLVPLEDRARTKSLQLAEELRRNSVRVVVDFSGKKVKHSVAAASELRAEWLLVIGEQELDSGRAMLKYLKDGSLHEVSLDQVALFIHLLNSRRKQGAP